MQIFTSFLAQLTLLLMAAVFAAPLAKRLGIGSVLGYLFAGILIGPFGLGLIYSVYQVGRIQHFAEFGVVMLLFLIGLELRPRRLWVMRSSIFGLGGTQVLVTGLILGVGIYLFGVAYNTAILLGLALALSSTAFALQVLEEKSELKSRHGRAAFSVLLFQDLAAIPLIALIPLFALNTPVGEGMQFWGAVRALAMICIVILVGRYVIQYLFRFVASTNIREAMTACALLIVTGVALLMEVAGLSAALGAFLAGALLAESEYRHEMEAAIKPFEGLLLGLFFTAVGMSLNLQIFFENPGLILMLAAALLAIKGAVLYLLGRWYGLKNRSARRFAIAISQGGEFAFVIFSAARGTGVIESSLVDLVSVVVTISLMATPLLLAFDDILIKRHRITGETPEFDSMPEEEAPVIIAGLGRFGQIAVRILTAKKIPVIALDADSQQVNIVRKFGNQVYYGDPARLDILRAAQAGKARAFMLAIDDVDKSVHIALLMRTHYPHVPIYARARDRMHVHRLMDTGVETILRETFLSSLDLTADMLRGLGLPEEEVLKTIQTFKEHDQSRLYDDYEHYTDAEKMQARTRASADELEELFSQDIEKELTDPTVIGGN